MFLTLSWVFLLSAVAVIFADRWIPYVRRWGEIPGVTLVLPLAIITGMVTYKMPWVIKGVEWLYLQNQQIVHFLLAQCPSFAGKTVIIPALWMSVIAMIPTFWFYLVAKPFRPFSPPYSASHGGWLVLMILMVLWLK